MKTTSKAVDALREKGVEFPAQLNRLELAKKDAKGVPQSTGPHHVVILRDEKRDDIRVFTGANSYKEVAGIRYWFNENGQEKFYEVPLLDKSGRAHYLLEKFAELNEGDKIVIEYVRKGDKGFINIAKAEEELPSINLYEGDEGSTDATVGEPDISF
jgi:hypothetical protein